MKRMNNVITVRLPTEDIKVIENIALKAAKDKSTILRYLVEQGKVYFAIKQYSDGKISLGKAAEIAGVSISEMMDLLAELGVKNHLEVEDYLEGEKVAEKLF